MKLGFVVTNDKASFVAKEDGIWAGYGFKQLKQATNGWKWLAMAGHCNSFLICWTQLIVVEQQLPYILDLPVNQTQILGFFQQQFPHILDLPVSQTQL